MTLRIVLALCLFLFASAVTAFTTVLPSRRTLTTITTITTKRAESTIVSPFGSESTNDEITSTAPEKTGTESIEGPLDLTWDNVELVLDTMRDFLIQDGGNVAIQAIDGPVVRLELQGACGTCPSSTMTMKMGLERGFKERIPEIQEVVQGAPDGPELNIEQVEVVLNGVRPFLNIAGGTIECTDIYGVEGIQPCISLYMTGNAASLKSVKMEIVQRLQRHFMIPMLRIEWDEDDDDD